MIRWASSASAAAAEATSTRCAAALRSRYALSTSRWIVESACLRRASARDSAKRACSTRALVSPPFHKLQRSDGGEPVRTAFTNEILPVGLDDPLKGDLRPVGGAGDLLLRPGKALGEFGLPHFRTVLSGQAAVLFQRAVRRADAELKRRRQLERAIEAHAK